MNTKKKERKEKKKNPKILSSKQERNGRWWEEKRRADGPVVNKSAVFSFYQPSRPLLNERDFVPIIYVNVIIF